MGGQLRDYCLTINNPIETDIEFKEYLEKLKIESHLKYAVFQREIGEKKQTPHFQIYLEFSQGKRFDTIKKYFPKAHIEQRRGKKAEAREYCMKDKKEIKGENGDIDFSTRIGAQFYEIGEFVDIGDNSSIFDEMIMDIESGIDEYDFNRKYRGKSAQYPNFYAKNKGLFVQHKYKREKRDIVVTYLYGKTGTGKTTYVCEKYGYENVYVVDDIKFPFDNYEYQDIILFDEFRAQYDINKILRWLDRHPLVLPARYNNRQACYTKVYLTSNIPLDKQYVKLQTDEPETYKAFLRRIHKVIDFDKINVPEQMTLTPIDDKDLPF
jgi:hypothetical protein